MPNVYHCHADSDLWYKWVRLSQHFLITNHIQGCRIRGSEIIENMQLDQKFALNFVTELSWKSSVPANGGWQCHVVTGVLGYNSQQ